MNTQMSESHSFLRPVRCVAVATSVLLLANGQVLANGIIEKRVDDILAQMTLAEKIGQMTQVDSAALTDKSHVQKYFLGSVLSGGGSDPADNSPQAWLNLVQGYQSWAGKTRLKIPLLYGVDAVHGHNNVLGAVIFPHNIGLGAMRNPALVEAAARVTAKELAGTGINWAFAPCVAVAQDARWGRTYESFGDSPALAGELGAAAVRGLQHRAMASDFPVLACAKHFAGDGGTQGGVDQGNVVMSQEAFRKVHISPYEPAIKDGVGSVMASFNSLNGAKLHGNKHLLTDVLKGELGFSGFVVSDWAAIDQLGTNYTDSIAAAVNAGVDMAMVPNGPGQANNYLEFITKLTGLVQEKRVSQARIDDAVRRILRAKIQAGIFEQPVVNPAWTAAIGSPEHRKVARECVRQSLVVLKNESAALPLAKNLKRVQVVGQAADDLGRQCGGWTISWQGETGKVTKGGTTILEAIRQTAGANTEVVFSADGSSLQPADAVVVVVGETPYAEMKGDRQDLRLSASDVALIQKAKKTGAPVVTVLLSGRPLVLGEALATSDAFVAAWLPGTEGQGVTDILFGEFKPTGKLPRAWPAQSEPTTAANGARPQAGFPAGYGLTFDTSSASQRPVRTAAIQQ